MKLLLFNLALLVLPIICSSQDNENIFSSSLSLKEEQGSTEADPFVSSGLSPDTASNDANTPSPEDDQEEDNESKLSTNTSDNDKGTEANLGAKAPGSLESMGMIDNNKNSVQADLIKNPNVTENKQKNNSAKKPNVTKDDVKKDFNKKDEVKKDDIKKTEDKKDDASRYWTELMIDNKSKKVLVNIKTVTIIESITCLNPASTRIKKSSAAIVPMTSTQSKSESPSYPYIKIQMPSSSRFTDKPSTSQTQTRSANSNDKKKKQTSTSPSRIKPTNKTTYSNTGNSANKSSPKSAAATTNSKNTKSTSRKLPSAAILAPVSSNKKDGFIQQTSTANKNVAPVIKKDDPTSVGSIFNVLKNLPSGGSEANSVYVEGQFKFPKTKEISKKIYKLSGYVSQN